MPHAVFILQIEKAPTGAELAVEARYVTAYSESAAPFAFDRGRASPRCRLQFPLLPVKGQLRRARCASRAIVAAALRWLGP